MAAVAHFPGSLDRGPLERVRRPLAVIAALLLVVDLIGLGLHLADGVKSPFADDTPRRAKTSVGGPEAVVPSSDVFGARTERGATSRTATAATPLGCLALESGCYPAAAPPAAPAGTPPSAGPATPPPSTQPVPVAQADLAVPALGTQVTLGVGEGSCTSVNLTVLALGDCPVTSGDGPVILNLGGSLLGN